MERTTRTQTTKKKNHDNKKKKTYTWKNYLAYLKENPQGYWFKRRLYGWGWVPVTWQGWLITLLFVAAIIALAPTLNKPKPLLPLFYAELIILIIALLWICHVTGEKPRWSWGR